MDMTDRQPEPGAVKVYEPTSQKAPKIGEGSEKNSRQQVGMARGFANQSLSVKLIVAIVFRW